MFCGTLRVEILQNDCVSKRDTVTKRHKLRQTSDGSGGVVGNFERPDGSQAQSVTMQTCLRAAQQRPLT